MSLSHFYCSDDDSLISETTPAGRVLLLTLADRRDFEMLLIILTNKSVIKKIPSSQGASILDGVVNWNRIHAHMAEFVKEAEKNGIENPDTDTEFASFTLNLANYKEALIVLSVGPYSAFSASAVGIAEDKWIYLSNIIRKYHECTHFVCRRLYREKINAIWDELISRTKAKSPYDIAIALEENYDKLSAADYL